MLSFNIIDIFILNQVLPSIFNKVAHQTWHECFVLIKLDSSNSHRQTSSTRPVQSFETQYLNTNYFTFMSIFGQIFGLRNHLGDIKVFDVTFDLVEI